MNNWSVIDEMLERVVRPDRRQKNLREAGERLVPLLATYGYHQAPARSLVYMACLAEGDWPYLREDSSPLSYQNCDEEKPYQFYFGIDCLVIHHGHLCTDDSREHEVAFLMDMIPVIGKLDAQAVLDPGEGDNGPWLRIYL